MMHRCSNNMVGQCTCGHFHCQSNSFTMLFSMPNTHHKSTYDETDMYPFASSSSASSTSVDCTLSLGTPSTRLTEDDDKRSFSYDGRTTSSNCMSNFCWDILQTKNTPLNSQQIHKSNPRPTNTNTSANNDPLLARRCANCDTTSTPLWRNGPRGPKSLCNACGIRFKKEERRASAANYASSTNNGNASSGTIMEQHYGAAYQSNNNSWVQAQKMPCISPANEFRFIEESDRDSDTSAIPFLSWRLNVTDRPSLVHNFTR